jgi:hypothetical protein
LETLPIKWSWISKNNNLLKFIYFHLPFRNTSKIMSINEAHNKNWLWNLKKGLSLLNELNSCWRWIKYSTSEDMLHFYHIISFHFRLQSNQKSSWITHWSNGNKNYQMQNICIQYSRTCVLFTCIWCTLNMLKKHIFLSKTRRTMKIQKELL